jgi:hypothetical protein
MIHLRYLFILTVLSQLCACASGPVNNVDFNEKVNLKDFSGTYENKMEDVESSLDLLSTYLWPLAKNLAYKDLMNVYRKHKDINYVNIKYSESGLLFEAISNGCVAVKKIIEVNERFKNGQFKINSSYGNWSEVHIGPWYNRTTLGIDTAGNAKLRNLDRAGGLIFWIIPFVVFESIDHRIIQLTEKKNFPSCEAKDYWNN